MNINRKKFSNFEKELLIEKVIKKIKHNFEKEVV